MAAHKRGPASSGLTACRVLTAMWVVWRAAAQTGGEGGAAGGTDGGVGGSEVVGDAGGAEPGGDGASAAGEEDACQQQGQSVGRAPVQPVGQIEEDAGRQRGQVRQ